MNSDTYLPFEQVQEFLESWGIHFYDGHATSIPYQKYRDMLDDAARVGGNIFYKFIGLITATKDERGYVPYPGWEQVQWVYTSWLNVVIRQDARLLELAYYLENDVASKDFDYRFYSVDGHPRSPLGYACILFQDQGFRFNRDTITYPDFSYPVYQDTYGFDSAGRFFGLNLADTIYLFSPVGSGLGDKATPKQVATHIRKFLEKT